MNNDPNQAIEFQRFRKAWIETSVEIVKNNGGNDSELAAAEKLVAVTFDLMIKPDSHVFVMWCLAKEQAREDAKPRTHVFKRATHVGYAWTYPDACGGAMFNSRDEAIESAERCGFVVTNKEA